MNNNYNSANIAKEVLLPKPSALLSTLALDTKLIETIHEARQAIARIIQGQDPRRLVIIGPCSLHDPKAALEYAQQLNKAQQQYKNELLIVMRSYFSKPRTIKGWKGMVYDPHLDESHNLEQGLFLTRKLLIELNQLTPLASEFLDLITPCYFKDLIAWGAIGARTSASQTHRELASGLPMPVGFKNSVDGNIQIAVNAAEVASSPQHYLGLNSEGLPSLIETKGNPAAHVILRGSLAAPNYSHQHIEQTVTALEKAKLAARLIIDCSHGNSGKVAECQKPALDAILLLEQRLSSKPICGIMLESHLIGGKQALSHPLTYGQSITDACLSWDETEPLLEKLAKKERCFG